MRRRKRRSAEKRVKTVVEVDMAAASRHAAKFKAISDPTRLAIVACLSRVGEICVADLTEPLALSQPTVSHHLGLLKRAGLVEMTRRGTLAFYRVPPTALEEIHSAFAEACLEI
jgi:ArsR family transcriptional regulator